MQGLTRKEELVLLTVRALEENAYLVAIAEHLEKLTEIKLTLPSIHIPLSRLEKRGYLDSFLGQGSPVRGGRRKKIYRITKAGHEALAEYRRITDTLWAESKDSVQQKS